LPEIIARKKGGKKWPMACNRIFSRKHEFCLLVLFEKIVKGALRDFLRTQNDKYVDWERKQNFKRESIKSIIRQDTRDEGSAFVFSTHMKEIHNFVYICGNYQVVKPTTD
jgi:hypothetical protein